MRLTTIQKVKSFPGSSVGSSVRLLIGRSQVRALSRERKQGEVPESGLSTTCATALRNSVTPKSRAAGRSPGRSEEDTSELQSRENLVCRLLLEKKNHH